MKSTILALIVSAGIIGAAVLWIAVRPQPASSDPTPSSAILDSTGTQHVTLVAHNGYHPHSFTAKANTPTILTLVTDNTFDCSANVTIATLHYTTQLPATGTTTIDLGIRSSGETIIGGCASNSNGFTIVFN